MTMASTDDVDDDENDGTADGTVIQDISGNGNFSWRDMMMHGDH